MSGKEECPHLLCRYHLVGELSRRPEHEAERAMVSRLEGKWEATCALDVADTQDRGLPDDQLAEIMGIEQERVTQISAEATARVRRRLKEYEE